MRTAQRKDVVPVDPTKWTQPPVFKATATRICTRLFNRSGGAERFPGIGGAGLLIGGIALMAAAMRRFRAVGTSIETWRSTDWILVGGPYANTRNPIYIALLLIYIGIGVIANTPAVVALLPVLFAILHFGVVRREEDYLE